MLDHEVVGDAMNMLGLDTMKNEPSFASLRNAFRKVCLRHHPRMLLYHLASNPSTPANQSLPNGFDTFKRAVAVYARVGAALVMKGILLFKCVCVCFF